MSDNSDYTKYLKYKVKYFNLKKELSSAMLVQKGGTVSNAGAATPPTKDVESASTKEAGTTEAPNKETGTGKDESKKIEPMKNNIIIILFKADWCGHCQRFLPIWKNLEKEYNSKFNFITYDADLNPTEITEYNIKGYPTVMIKDNNNLSEYNGSKAYPMLSEFLNNLSN